MTTKHVKYGLKELERDYGVLTFGRILRAHRLGEEMSQVQMAKLLKISKQSLNDLESGRTIPSIGRAAEIADKIGLLKSSLVRLAINDQIRREELNFEVTLKEIKKKSKRVS